MKDEILRLLKEREHSYRCVLAQAALAKDGGVWKNVFTRFIALYRSDEEPVPLHYDYGEFLMVSRPLQMGEFQAVLESLEKDKKLFVPGTPLVPDVPMEGVFEQRQDEAKYLHSDEPHFKLHWPTNFYLFNPSSNCISSGKRAWALSHRDFPLFPDSTAAFESVFRVNVRGLTWEKAIAFCLESVP
ncbi:MAG: hypothetical protein Q8O40_00775 [Chloroflexota bacterium]|nr:hypothetical protein [Chloroflexota bacterium]